jgi:RHS repeat-associated protein
MARKHSVWKLTGGLVSAAVTAGLLAGVPASPAVAGHAAAPRLPREPAISRVGILRSRHERPPHVATYRPTAVSWPTAAQATVRLDGAAAPHATAVGEAAASGSTAPLRYAAGTPVWAQPVTAAAGRVTGVRVRVLSHAAAVAMGVAGVVFTAAPAPGSAAGTVRLGLSYAKFAQVYGGNYGLGLGLVELPSCALTTPQRTGCRTRKRLDWSNDTVAENVSAQVTLGVHGGGPVVLAAEPELTDGGGAGGNYAATSLRASGTWAEGGSSGSFTYAYPMAVPPAATGLAPELSLNYDSGTVDGQTAATQAQASWAGDGWSTPASYIEQSFVPCDDAGGDAPSASQDACYDGPILTLSQDGASNPLVCGTPFKYTVTTTCTPSDDNGEVVTYHVTSDNGSGTSNFYGYWTITTRDGTTSYFGMNRLPGWASGDKATNSVDTEPVFSPKSGQPCYSSSGFTDSVCTMAYRWNMDYVTSVHGGAMAYYYKQATNAYAEYGSSTAVPYVRDSYLDHIDYGFTAGNAYSGDAPDEVEFGTGDRCFTGPCDPISSNSDNWLDVPYQYNCAAGAASGTAGCIAGPTFWSTVALSSITTEQLNGGSYVPVDSWALQEEFPPTGDSTSPSLFLASIIHTGSDTTAGGSAVTLPTVTFTPHQYANRLIWNDYVPLVRPRIVGITTETGAVISVVYEQPSACSATSLPTPSTNDQSCFPVYWSQFPTSGSPDWFIKYAVKSVSVSDPTGGSPGTYTSYTYKPDSAAWHYDDNELVLAKYRTYGQWRGYQQVTTSTGTGADAQTEATTSYYQGMSDDNDSTAVTLTDSQGGKHDDTDQLAGNVLESTDYNYSGGPVTDSTIDSYWVSAPVASRSRTGLPALTANATGLVESWARQAITDTSPTTWRETETDTSYDATTSDADFGLPLFSYVHGDLTQPSQQTCTSTTYTAPNTAKNLVGLVAETETDAAPCGGPNPGGASAPTASEINALTAPTGLSRPADVISDTRTYYDDPPTLTSGTPEPSNPAWPQAAPSTGAASVVQQATGYTSGAFTYITKTATTYDSYGRPLDSYDANGNDTATTYTMTSGSTTTEKVTNALGQVTTTTLDPLRGIPAAITDPNNLTTTFAYDGLGRLTSVWADGRSPSETVPTVAYSYDVSDTAPTVVTTKTLNDEGGQVTSTTLYDALLRVRQTQNPTPQGGILVSDNFYDSHGWLAKTWTNWWDSGSDPSDSIVYPCSGSPCSPGNDSLIPDLHEISYDGLGRPVLDVDEDDSSDVSATATAYYGDRVTTADGKDDDGAITVQPTSSTPASTVTDALGRTTELDRYTSLPTVTTSTANDITTVTITGGTNQATDYAYNTRGELGTITDATSGEQWGKTYNLLGEITGTTDPNGGASTMTYDNNGNLATSTDADGHTISYTYDALNRKTGEYDGPTNSSPPIATWDYDNSNNAVPGMTNPIGQLTTETSYSGGNAYTTQESGFNDFGESLGETVTLPSAEGALAGSYTLSHFYTPTTGLLTEDSYPASPGGGALPAEKVNYGYETGFDLPATLAGAVTVNGKTTYDGYEQDVTYSAFFQVSQQEIGTPSDYAYVTNTYDPNTGNLTDTNVQNTVASPSTPYDDTQYSYDAAGNITSQTDTRNGAEAETQCYDYDALDQLTQAWTATDNCAANPANNKGATVGDGIPGSAYWTSWAFNSLGQRTGETEYNLTGGKNTVTDYSYNGNGTSQPNTLTGTSTTGPSGTSTASYSYDTDGNTLTRDLPSGNQKLTWTDDGKLATDTTSAGVTSYVYDANGNVLLQKDPAKTTLYLFGGAEQIVLNTTTKAITGTRFIQIPGGGEVVRTGASTSYTLELANQQGTGVLTLDSTCQNPQWQQYTPYGAPRGTPPESWPDTNGFLNKPTDQNTGLTILGARLYDPDLGQFISLDPLLDPSDPTSINGYTYANENPIGNTDPTGAYVVEQGNPGCTAGDPTSAACRNTGGSGGGCPDYDPGCPGFTGGGAGPSGEKIGGYTGRATPGTVITASPQPVELQAVYLTALTRMWETPQSAPVYVQWEAIAAACEQDEGLCAAGSVTTALDQIGIAQLQYQQAIDRGPRPSIGQILDATAGAASLISLAIAPEILGPEDAIAATITDATADGSDAGDLLEAGCNFSFTASTRVLLANGTTVPIDTLKPGDKVLATNTKTGKTTAETVTAVLLEHDNDLYNLTINTAHGQTAVIHTTARHPFWNPYLDKWVTANKLSKGEHLKTADGTVAVADGGTVPAGHDGWMWDLTVPGNNDHDFYVTSSATPILVHNCDDPIPGTGGTQVTSRTLMQNSDFHIDVENPNPGVRAGQLHLQDYSGNKYQYNFETGQFEGLPNSLTKQVARNPAVARAISTGLRYLGMG